MTHICNGQHETITTRLTLAALENDTSAMELIDAELGDCAKCWRGVAQWEARLLAGHNRARANGVEKAADSLADELRRNLMP